MVPASLAASATIALLAQAAPSPVVTRPAIDVSSLSRSRAAHIVTWDAGEVTCDNGVTFAADTIPRRIPVSASRPPQGEPRVTYEFTLGGEGRALSIIETAGVRSALYNGDLVPSLAAAQFAPQPVATTCAVTFTQKVVPHDEAALADLITLAIHSRPTRLPGSTWKRFVSGDCSATRVRQLERHTPDYRKLPKVPGANTWVMVSYDIDDAGAPTAIKTIDSSGEPQLEAASKKAISESRWIDGDPRTGCWRYGFTAADVIEAPASPELGQWGDWPEQCEAKDRWAKEPRLTYPENYRRRGIEGWAVFRYDVASWGEIGNVELLDAQPSRDLGEAARKVLMSAQYKQVPGGLTGCIERVRFRLPERGAEAPDED